MNREMPSSDAALRRVELIAVGREILRGRVLDTNSNWLAKELTGMGGGVSRICVVDDVPQEIVRELHAAMQHGAGVIITTGGLGPTFDDRTLESIAQAVDLPLVRHEAAYVFIAETYRRLHAAGAIAHQAMVPSREKMALLPQGAEMLPNPTGSAPGMLLHWQQHLLIAMPGPPGEMRPMFQASVAPLLQARWAGRHRVEIAVQTDVADESLLSPLFERVMAAVAGSYLKADPKGFGPEVRLTVYITGEGTSEEIACAIVHQAQDQLKKALEALGYGLMATEEAQQG
jgi:nicotinamide-nucleotide amidase